MLGLLLRLCLLLLPAAACRPARLLLWVLLLWVLLLLLRRSLLPSCGRCCDRGVEEAPVLPELSVAACRSCWKRLTAPTSMSSSPSLAAELVLPACVPLLSSLLLLLLPLPSASLAVACAASETAPGPSPVAAAATAGLPRPCADPPSANGADGAELLLASMTGVAVSEAGAGAT